MNNSNSKNEEMDERSAQMLMKIPIGDLITMHREILGEKEREKFFEMTDKMDKWLGEQELTESMVVMMMLSTALATMSVRMSREVEMLGKAAVEIMKKVKNADSN